MGIAVAKPISADRHLVLVADDDDAVLDLVARVIVQFGLVPLRVSNGAAAVEAALVFESALACVILDVDMPVLNGADAAHAIQQRAAGLAIVMMSGGVPAALAARLQQLNTAAFLSKPFHIAELRDALAQATGRA